MSICGCSRRRLLGYAGTALAVGVFGLAAGPVKAGTQRLAGKPVLKRRKDGSLARPGFAATTAGESAVLRVGPQIFYMDPSTQAEFAEGDDGLVSEIVIKAGGMLSLFGPRAGKGVSIATECQRRHSRHHNLCCLAGTGSQDLYLLLLWFS